MTTIAPPRRRPAASVVAPVIAVLFIAAAVVTVRDLAVSQSWTTGSTWTGSVVDSVDGLTATWWVVAAGIVLALIGLLLVVLAVKPRRRSHHATALSGDVWVTSSALSAVAVSAAEETPGVADATARIKRGRVAVTVQSHETDIQSEVEENVSRRLEGFTDRSVVVKLERVSEDA